MDNIIIYLIEDNLEDSQKTIVRLNEYSGKKYRSEKYHFKFIPLEGTIARNLHERDWKFYEPGIIDVIKNKMVEEEQDGNIMGLLLDTLLTEEDLEYSRSQYYPKATLGREIYNEFCKTIPIYIITGILNFGTQSDIIMGVDLRDSYILKTSLDDSGDVFIKCMFDKYIDMIEKKGTTE